jgi:hypothetical protein
MVSVFRKSIVVLSVSVLLLDIDNVPLCVMLDASIIVDQRVSAVVDQIVQIAES